MNLNLSDDQDAQRFYSDLKKNLFPHEARITDLYLFVGHSANYVIVKNGFQTIDVFRYYGKNASETLSIPHNLEYDELLSITATVVGNWLAGCRTKLVAS